MTEIQSILSSRFAGTFFDEPGEALELKIEVDPATELTLNRLIAAGMRPLIAGGAVRDAILGTQPKDFDIEVHGAKSFEELHRLLKPLGQLNLTGRDFGVLKLRIRSEDGSLSDEIDLTLPRRDSKVGAGHRGFTIEVDPEMGLLEATARRDLTVNALVWDPTSSLVIDLNGGLKDMEDGVLRHVSDAFSEDPLRVLRVARFASKLGFRVAPETVEISRGLRSTFPELAAERISGELSRMILERFPKHGFGFLRDSGWGEILGIPVLAYPALGWCLERGLSKTDELGTGSQRRIVQLAVLANLIPEQNRETTLRYFAATKAEVKRALAIEEAPSPIGISHPAARQWAWDNQSITAREKIVQEDILRFGDQPETAAARAQFGDLGIIAGPEKDRFDSEAIIRAHREANPDLKGGPWIREVLQEARTAQYER